MTTKETEKVNKLVSYVFIFNKDIVVVFIR